MVKVLKIATGVRLPKPIMQIIDAAAARWFCDRGQAITHIVLEWEQLRANQIPLTCVDLQTKGEENDPGNQ